MATRSKTSTQAQLDKLADAAQQVQETHERSEPLTDEEQLRKLGAALLDILPIWRAELLEAASARPHNEERIARLEAASSALIAAAGADAEREEQQSERIRLARTRFAEENGDDTPILFGLVQYKQRWIEGTLQIQIKAIGPLTVDEKRSFYGVDVLSDENGDVRLAQHGPAGVFVFGVTSQSVAEEHRALVLCPWPEIEKMNPEFAYSTFCAFAESQSWVEK